jgi:hypothetical protein
VTPQIRVLALANSQLTHGGIDVVLNLRQVAGSLVASRHDQLSRDNFLNLEVLFRSG